jgi:protein-S-isoprenylcysteine O-methyltransferase Ste14
MARPKFKHRFKQYADAALVRPTYLLVSVVTLNLLIFIWRPIGGWGLDLRGSALGYVLIGAYVLGWIIEVAASYQIDHFHLFGLRQSFAKLMGKDLSRPAFSIPPFYRVVRHPIYTGWLMVFWLTPYFTLSHFLFALGMTIYIRIATYYEEQDLIHYFGDNYTRYMEQVPTRYIPMVV